MGYSVDESIVRMDVFSGRRGGRWDADYAVQMRCFYDAKNCKEAVIKAAKSAGVSVPSNGTLVALEPFHRTPLPIIVTGREYNNANSVS